VDDPGPPAEGESPAIWKGAYRTIYADQDVMVFERRHATESVVVAVKRGEAATIDLPRAVHLDPGVYPGPLTGTSAANANNRLAVGPGGKATIFLESLGALVVWSSQSPQ